LTYNFKDFDLNSLFLSINSDLSSVDSIITENIFCGIDFVDKSLVGLINNNRKRIRCALVVLFSKIARVTNTDLIFKTAACVEILHNAALIHDDIIDSAKFRRGSISVPVELGNQIAVLAGDYLFARSLSVLPENISVIVRNLLISAVQDMTKGELLQLSHKDLISFDEDLYYQTIFFKTAKFMSVCCFIGQKLAANSKYDLISSKFGEELGMAFQIIDDVNDYEFEFTDTGKTIGVDYFEGKITLPLIVLWKNSTLDFRKKIIKLFSKRNKRNFNKLCKLLKDSEALSQCRNIALQYAENCRELLKKLPDSESKDVLQKLTYFVIDRKY
jgi:octaprenyl-diphosphate synthase